MYDATLKVFNLYHSSYNNLKDFEKLEEELLRIGTLYISSKRFEKNKKRGPAVDHLSFLEDLFESELLFQKKKQKLLECYIEVYEHILDSAEQKRMAQAIINLIALRPLFDLDDNYFVPSYQAHVKVLEAELELWRELINSHIEDQSYIKTIFKDEKMASKNFYAGGSIIERVGFPDPLISTEPIKLFKDSLPIGVLDFHNSIAVLTKLPEILLYNLQDISKTYRPRSPRTMNYFYFGILQLCLDEFKAIKDNKYILVMDFITSNVNHHTGIRTWRITD